MKDFCSLFIISNFSGILGCEPDGISLSSMFEAGCRMLDTGYWILDAVVSFIYVEDEQ